VTSKAALITGCSSGIGHATAQRLLADGYRVYATARRPQAIADLADAGATTLALDVTDESSMTAAVQTVVDAEGAVGVLVNNAGYSQSGAIINIGSMGRRLTFPGAGIYHSTKYALESISDSLRFEVRGFGVHVVQIEPGLIVTGFGDVASGSADTIAEGPYTDFNRHVAKTPTRGRCPSSAVALRPSPPPWRVPSRPSGPRPGTR
jgi:NADP-dependent 3-hydroxy acid dehydrogenase YdfG